MEDVKRRVINIVNGLPPEHGQNTVVLAPDEIVVKTSDHHLTPEQTVEAIHRAMSNYVPTTEPQGDGAEIPFFQGGEIPAGITYLVGERGCCGLPHADIPTPDLIAMNDEAHPPRCYPKPFVRFKMLWDHVGLIVPADDSIKFPGRLPCISGL